MGRYQPALLGGLFIGVLSVLPGINLLNFCCCLWVVVGGVLTTYLMQQQDPAPLEASSAALGGLIAGAIGGVINAVAAAVMFSMGGEEQQQAIEELMQSMGNVPPEMAAMMERFTNGPFMAIVGGALIVPVYSVFGLLGALLGLAFFRRKAAPPAPPAGPDQVQTPTLR